MTHIITVAATTAAIVLLRALFVALVRQPAKALMNKYKVVKTLSQWWWIKDQTLDGEWTIVWSVKSKNFPERNKDTAVVFKFLHYVAAEIEILTNEGVKIRYGFVGQLHGAILTGGWFDSRDAKIGYYGPFQVVLAPTRDKASGKWVGFAHDRTVKAGDLFWTRVETKKATSLVH